MGLLKRGKVTLASGQESWWLIDCGALDDEDWSVIAELLAERLPAFGWVEGVPRGGLRLAEAMLRHRDLESGRLLIVDDVWTTGGSVGRHRAGRDALVAVAFARDAVPAGVTALFPMHPR